MSLVFLFGPPAVGKMRVGHEIAEATGFALLHNHRTIDLLTDFFEFDSEPFRRVNEPLRRQILEELAAAGRGVVMTGAWRFDVDDDARIVDTYCEPFRTRGRSVCFVELRGDLGTRLERNRSEWRRERKKVDWADDECIREESRLHRFETAGDFPYPDEHLIVDTIAVGPAEAAAQVVTRFGLPLRAASAG